MTAEVKPPDGQGKSLPWVRPTQSPWIWPVVLLAGIYIFIPVTPTIPVENDDMRIALGAYALSLHQAPSDDLLYRYDAQPGTYLATMALHRLFHLETLTTLCFLSALGAGVFLTSTAVLLSWLTSLPLALCLLSTLLIPEVFICSYFGNSTSTAALFLGPALLLSWRASLPRAVVAGVTWGLAMWCRFDALLAGPLLGVLCWRDETSAKRVGTLWCVGIATSTSLMLLADASFARLFASFGEHRRHFVNLTLTAGCYSTLISSGCLLALAAGLIHAVRHRHWRQSMAVISGILPLVGAYGLTVTTPKYFYFGIPSILLGTIMGVTVAADEHTHPRSTLRKYLCLAISLLIIGQYFLPLRSSWAVQSTADGPRCRLMIAATPLLWWRVKAHRSTAYDTLTDRLRDALAENQDITIITNGWMENSVIPYHLLMAGFRINTIESRNFGTRFEMARNDRHVSLITIRNPETASEISSDWLPTSCRPIYCFGRRDTTELGDMSPRTERRHDDIYPVTSLHCTGDDPKSESVPPE